MPEMTHLLNCRECDWWTVVEGPYMLADVQREEHVDSIRNWGVDSEELCPMDSVACAVLPDDAEVSSDV